MPLSNQAKNGMARLSKYCLDMLMGAISERQARVDKKKSDYLARLEEEKELRKKQEDEKRLREIEVSIVQY